jgi:hypothetical protein
VRAHGSLVRKEAAAYFLSRDAYPYIGDEQNDGRGTKSGIGIASLAATLKRKTKMMSIIALIVVLIMPLGIAAIKCECF